MDGSVVVKVWGKQDMGRRDEATVSCNIRGGREGERVNVCVRWGVVTVINIEFAG